MIGNMIASMKLMQLPAYMEQKQYYIPIIALQKLLKLCYG